MSRCQRDVNHQSALARTPPQAWCAPSLIGLGRQQSIDRSNRNQMWPPQRQVEHTRQGKNAIAFGHPDADKVERQARWQRYHDIFVFACIGVFSQT